MRAEVVPTKHFPLFMILVSSAEFIMTCFFCFVLFCVHRLPHTVDYYSLSQRTWQFCSTQKTNVINPYVWYLSSGWCYCLCKDCNFEKKERTYSYTVAESWNLYYGFQFFSLVRKIFRLSKLPLQRSTDNLNLKIFPSKMKEHTVANTPLAEVFLGIGMKLCSFQETVWQQPR